MNRCILTTLRTLHAENGDVGRSMSLASSSRERISSMQPRTSPAGALAINDEVRELVTEDGELAVEIQTVQAACCRPIVFTRATLDLFLERDVERREQMGISDVSLRRACRKLGIIWSPHQRHGKPKHPRSRRTPPSIVFEPFESTFDVTTPSGLRSEDKTKISVRKKTSRHEGRKAFMDLVVLFREQFGKSHAGQQAWRAHPEWCASSEPSEEQETLSG
mmetsp:Transcript_25133/g.51076  ORF Transcript_25133/g.51076 Transcript_25133/m.51076 type:complete len:220 (+) Transcript_25133:143-802(+)